MDPWMSPEELELRRQIAALGGDPNMVLNPRTPAEQAGTLVGQQGGYVPGQAVQGYAGEAGRAAADEGRMKNTLKNAGKIRLDAGTRKYTMANSPLGFR